MAYTTRDIATIELDRFSKDTNATTLYKEGIDRLKRSGIVAFLRTFSRPYNINGGANVYQSAYASAHSEGYNKALDDLIYFSELYLTPAVGTRGIVADFGGRKLALAKGDLTEDDLNGK